MRTVLWIATSIWIACLPASIRCQPCKTAAEWKDIREIRNHLADAGAKASTMWSVTYKGFQVEKTKERKVEFAPNGQEVREFEYYKNGLVRFQFDYSYDDSGRLAVSKVQFQGKPAGQWEYEYNSAGLVMSHKFIDTTGTVIRRHFFQYIDTSEILETMCDSAGLTLCARVNKYEGHRDSGILIETSRELPGGIRDLRQTNEFVSGRWSSQETLNRKSKVTQKTSIEYDENGRFEKTVVIDGFGEKASETTARFSTKGLLELLETRDGLGYLKSRIQYEYEFYD